MAGCLLGLPTLTSRASRPHHFPYTFPWSDVTEDWTPPPSSGEVCLTCHRQSSPEADCKQEDTQDETCSELELIVNKIETISESLLTQNSSHNSEASVPSNNEMCSSKIIELKDDRL